MRRLCFALLACLALTGCGIGWGGVQEAGDDDAAPNCVPPSKGSHADREAGERQCRADQTDGKVYRQQTMHDQGMSMPQPW